MRIDLNNWVPDLPAHMNPGCIEAKNVVPLVQSFGPLKNLNTLSNALTNAALGAKWIPDFGGNVNLFAGDKEYLYRYAEATAAWTDKSSATYDDATSWAFEKFGNRCIAVSKENVPQYYNMSDTAAGTFSDLGGSPPKAKYVATVRDFLVLGNLENLPMRVRWSAFNNSDLWAVDLATQADFQDLPGRGGAVQGIVPGEYGVVFTENSIWRMDYVGPPIVFSFDELERGRGTPAPNSIVWYGGLVFYYDYAGFHVFNGQSSTPIGNNRVDEWFRKNNGDLTSVYGALDRTNDLIVWAFKSVVELTNNDRILIYSMAADKWAWGEVDTQIVFEAKSNPVTSLDALDNILTDIDSTSINMDEADQIAGSVSLQGFDTANKSGAFDGTALQGLVISREFSMDEHRTELRSARPLVDGGTVTVQFGSKNDLAATTTYSNAISLNRLGEARKVVNARYHKVRLNLTGDFQQVHGVELRSRQSGRR